jgi:hypothetical protein
VGRPCEAVHPEPVHGCRLCWLAANDVRYQTLWELPASAPREPSPFRTGGPGTELQKLLASLGLTAGGCACEDRARQMDAWGPAGCREREAEIVAWLREEQAKHGWGETLRAAARAVADGLAFRLNPLDPLPGLVREAIRRAEPCDRPG